MTKNHRIIDLIYLNDTRRTEAELKSDYQSRLQLWKKWLHKRQNLHSEAESTFVEEQNEYVMIENLLNNFIEKRLEWVLKSVTNSELRKKYLRLFPPFYQDRKIKEFLFHFFQIHDGKQGKKLQFYFLNKSEKEVRILWDVYKLTRTIKSIQTIKRALAENHQFSSDFTSHEIRNTLDSLNKAIQLLIKICIKPEHYQTILKQFPKSVFKSAQILHRKKHKQFLVNDIILEKFDYRNYFFHIYFKPYIKAIYAETEYTFNFNYLDYEIIRQEFLIDWIHRRLKNNSHKAQILNQYTIGNNTFSEIISKNPAMEITLLKRLPKDAFNNIIAEVNDAVDAKLKMGVDPMSKHFGEFSKMFKAFQRAGQLAQKSVSVLEQLIKSARAKKQRTPVNFPAAARTESARPLPDYKIVRLQEDDINFPFLTEKNSTFKTTYGVMLSKITPERYGYFNKRVEELLSRIPKSKVIIRRTPRHEWSVPFLFKDPDQEERGEQVLILGAEVKSKPLGMGYTGSIEGGYTFSSYFVYGTREQNPDFGIPVGERVVKGKTYYIYPYNQPEMVERVLKLTEKIVEESDVL